MYHSIKIKVRGYHLDFYGHVNNARYLEFLEEARWAYLEETISLADCAAQGTGFVVASITINYRLPANLDAILEVRSLMTKVGGRSGIIHQQVIDTATNKTIADADITFVVVDTKTARPKAIEGDIRLAFQKFTSDPQ